MKLKLNCNDFSQIVAELDMSEDSRTALYQCAKCKEVWSVLEFRIGPRKYKTSKKEEKITYKKHTK